MGNMSYCRFHNTLGALRDCRGALDTLINGEEALSKDELDAAKRLVQECVEIVEIIAHAADVAPEDLDEDAINDTLDDLNTDAAAKEEEDE